jgi:hypothetical protein
VKPPAGRANSPVAAGALLRAAVFSWAAASLSSLGTAAGIGVVASPDLGRLFFERVS